MKIRLETPADAAAIAELTRATFTTSSYGHNGEAEIIAALRAAGALELSLVASAEAQLLGHLAFSQVEIDGVSAGWRGLGPVSVRPDQQGRGIGAALIRRGLEMLHQRGAAGCVVLGEPDYYRRFGFEAQAGLRFPQAPPEYFMCQTLSGDELPSGTVRYHPAFTAG